MNYMWLDPMNKGYVDSRNSAADWISKIDSFIVFGSDLRNLHRGEELRGRRFKTCLIEFFNSLDSSEKIWSSAT